MSTMSPTAPAPKPTRYISESWQLGEVVAGARIWSYIPGVGAVVIATFNTSRVLRDETKKANARRAVACVNFCVGRSTEEIEAMIKNKFTLVDATQSKQAVEAMGHL